MSDRLGIIEMMERIEEQVDAIEYIVGETISNETNPKIANGLFHSVMNCTNIITKYREEVEKSIRKL